MKITVPIYGQRDSRWSGNILGNSSVTIGGYGCLITCLAMLAKYYGHETDPAQFNQALINIDGYAAEANNGPKDLYKWYEGISKIYSDISITKLQNTPYRLTDVDFNAIKAEIDAGRPVIIQVDFNPADAAVQMHFVLLTGYEGDTYYVNDPWYGDNANLTRYGDPATTIQQYIFHNGPVPQAGTWDTIPVLKSDFERLVTKATSLDNQKPTYQELQSMIQQINTDVEGLKREKDALWHFVEQSALMLQVPASTEKILGQISMLVSAESDLNSCRSDVDKLTQQITELQASIEAKEKERKDAVDRLLPLTSENIELKKQIDALTIDRNNWKKKYETLLAKRKDLSQYTRKELIIYILSSYQKKV